MTVLQIDFEAIRGCRELAEKLNVDIKALDLVELLPATCGRDGCNLPAANNNYNPAFCAVKVGIHVSSTWMAHDQNTVEATVF